MSVNSYLIQDMSTATTPSDPSWRPGSGTFFYFATERGRLGLTANRRGIARLIWTRNSPNWHFDDAMLDRAARAFDNPDYVEIVIHSYRHRLGLAPGHPPTTTSKTGSPTSPSSPCPPSPWTAWQMGTSRQPTAPPPRTHRQVPNAGHNLPQEAPHAFAEAVLDLATPKPDA